MALRIRLDGRIFCAALNEPMEGDIYLHDGIHYQLSVEEKVLVTTPNEYHMKNGGEWWWKGREPKDTIIDSFYMINNKTLKMTPEEKAIELFNAYEPYSLNFFSSEIEPRKQKEMASICVNELITAFELLSIQDSGSINRDFGHGYWQDVKAEIENLVV